MMAFLRSASKQSQRLRIILEQEERKHLSHKNSLLPSSSSYQTNAYIASIMVGRALHPWPEWVTFVDRLKAKGYFSQMRTTNKDALFYTDSKLLKDGCFNFACHRFDLLKSLSSQDIQTVVEKGCPNLFGKVVDSAKRLRAHLQLHEADVCGACKLRGSCDRPYVIPTEDEASARTVDVVRILLLYALDASVLSGGRASLDRITIETSVRRLLSELIKLTDTVPAPEINITPEPLKFDDDHNIQNVEIKDGYWRCSRCNFMNIARNNQCSKCHAAGPKKYSSFIGMKKGDWNCPGCGFMHFASKSYCFRCRERRPPMQLEPGEWECLSCYYVNFRKNITCRKCNCDRPRSGVTLSSTEKGEIGL